MADISSVMEAMERLLDDSIATNGYKISEPASTVDLSQTDFEVLMKQFVEGRKRTEAERLKGAISSTLARMVRLNRIRMDFAQRFQELIDEYNEACGNGNPDIDLFFSRLVAFAQDLNEEEKRGISEQLSQEELAVFDLLTKPEMRLTEKERVQVKLAARNLLAHLRLILRSGA